MRLAIIGAGRIGLAINDLLEDDFDIKLCDSRVAAETYGVNLPIVDFIDASDIKMLGSFIDYSDVVISAVNYKFNSATTNLVDNNPGKFNLDISFVSAT